MRDEDTGNVCIVVLNKLMGYGGHGFKFQIELT